MWSRAPHEIERAKCDWEGHMWLKGYHVIERALCNWGVLLLDYIGHRGLWGTCVYVGLPFGVHVNNNWQCSPIMQPQTICQCYSPVRHRMAGHWCSLSQWSLFTIAIVLVYFNNLAFNNGLMNLYLWFGVFDLYVINVISEQMTREHMKRFSLTNFTCL